MKLRTQRVLITLLAFLTVGIALVNAYTFNVVNRTPFGVLNLEKLILKPDTTHTGIIIDGSEYKIKIDPYHEIADGGQIRVYQICDEKGDNCKNVANLGQGGGDGVQILDGQEGYICTKSGNNLVCNTTGTNSLNDFDFITGQDNRLCRKSGNKVVCNSRFGNGNLMIYSLNQNNPVSVIDGNGSISSIPLDGSGNYQVYIPYIPVVTGTDQYICVKNGGDMVCDKTTLGTMSNTKYCYYSGNAIHCTKDAPGNATITLQTKSGSTVTRSGSFQVNTTQNKTITIPSGGGGIPGQKGDPGDTGAYVTSAHIEGNNIIFVLSNGNEIELTDVIQTITGPQGEAGATGAIGATGATGNGISSVTTGKNGKITTVTFNYTNGAPSTSFQISDGADGNGGSGINVEGTPDGRCQYQCGNGSINITWNCSNLNGEERVHCDTDMGKYQQECGNTEITGNCKQNAKNIYFDHPTWLTLTYNNGSDCSIVCDQSEPSCQGQCEGGSGDTIINGIQVTHYSGGKVCKYMTQAAVDLFNRTLSDEDGALQWTIPEGSGEIRCVFDGGSTAQQNDGIEITQTGTLDEYCASTDGKTLICNNTITASPDPTGGSGDTYWTRLQDSNNGNNGTVGSSYTVTPLAAGYNVNIGQRATTPYKLNVNGIVQFQEGSQATAKFAGSSVAFFGARNFTLQNMFFYNQNGSVQSQLSKTIPGFMVNGAIAAGTQNDYIYMYAGTGSSGTGVGKHYEIMGNNKLSVGTKDGAFVYFTEKNQTYTNYINAYTPDASTLAAASSSTPGLPTNSIPAPSQGTITYDKIYSSLMVGVNTDNPKATLDINGTIKVGANCLLSTTVCTGDIVGTILYFTDSSQSGIGRLAICMNGSNGGYKWHDLISGTEGQTLAAIGYSQYCNIPLASEALPGTLLPAIE